MRLFKTSYFLIRLFIIFIGFNINSSYLYADDIHIAATPKSVIEGKCVKVSVWIDSLNINESRSVLIKVDPTSLFDSRSQWNITIPAGKDKIEFDVETENNNILENDYANDGFGTRTGKISAQFGDSTDETSIYVIDDDQDNSGDLFYVSTYIEPFDAGTKQKFQFWVMNSTGSDIYSRESVQLDYIPLGYPYIEIFPNRGSISKILSNHMEYSEPELRPDDSTPPGKYYIKVIGSQNGTNKFLAVQSFTINNDRKPDYEIENHYGYSLTFNPGFTFEWCFICQNDNDCFAGIPLVIFYLEHEGVKNIVYKTYADIQYYGDRYIINPDIEFPTEPGTYKFWAEINNLTENQLDELDFSNNISEKSIITIRDNRPELKVSPLTANISSVANTISFNVSNTGIQKDMEWTAVSNHSWISFNNGQSGVDNGQIIVYCSKNLGETRSGTITVSAPGAKTSEQTIHIYQEKNPPSPDIPPNPQITYECESSIVSFEPPPENVSWYWQSSPDGEDISDFNLSKKFYETSKFYVRSRMNVAPYYWSENCQTGTVSVFSKPLPPVVDSPSIIKGDQTTLHVSGTWITQWYANTTDNESIYKGNDYTLSPEKTTTYYVTQSNEYCESDKQSVTVFVYDYTYSWHSSSWSLCDSNCTQTREVNCQRNDNSQVDDRFCIGTKPALIQECIGGTCEYLWKYTSWSLCNINCLQNRDVYCEKSNGVTVNDNYCKDIKPDSTQSCNSNFCTLDIDKNGKIGIEDVINVLKNASEVEE